MAARIQAIATDTPGLSVPVEVGIDIDDRFATTPAFTDALVERFIDAATSDTPSPAELHGGPLERLDG